jgi:hypothetical protein
VEVPGQMPQSDYGGAAVSAVSTISLNASISGAPACIAVASIAR